MKNYSPILLFTYKRFETLKKTVEALQANYLAPDSELFIFSDGPKLPTDIYAITLVRNYIKTIDGFKKITIFESEANIGLANSIINGVSEIINSYGRVIVLEDDLITTPNFLNFMNDSLSQYYYKANIFSISGYSFNLGFNPSNTDDAYFLFRGWSWGWATWEDRWVNVDWQVKDYELFLTDSVAKKSFAKGGSDLNKMLSKQMTGKIDSWAIRWFYYQFKVGGMTLYPVFSKVINYGFDLNATHTTGSASRYIPLLDTTLSTAFQFPDSDYIDSYYHKMFLSKMSIFSRFKSRFASIILNIKRIIQ